MIHRILMVFAILATFTASPAVAGGRKTVRLVPDNASPVELKIDGKSREYYLLRRSVPLTLRVEGPGKLTVFSRLEIAPGGTVSPSYSIRVKEGKNTLKMYSTTTGPSEAVFPSTGETAGKSRKFMLTVPEGSFTYVFTLEGTDRDAACRFTFAGSKDSRKRTAIEPLTYDRIVTATVGEKLLAYYVSTPSRPATLRVVGPTTVRVTTRLNYDEKMKGSQKFAIIVSERGTRVATRPLQTTKSVDVSYREWREVVPGKSQAFSFEVPDGEHVYAFTLDQSLAASISLRFSIPRADVANEE